jgi:hypothetical protein
LSVTHVCFYVNGMVMAFDESGEQVPHYQGVYEHVVAKIKADFPDAVWEGPLEWYPGQAKVIKKNYL